MLDPPISEYDENVSVSTIYAPTDIDTRVELLVQLANLVVLQERVRRSVMQLTGQRHASSFTSGEWKQALRLLADDQQDNVLRNIRAS